MTTKFLKKTALMLLSVSTSFGLMLGSANFVSAGTVEPKVESNTTQVTIQPEKDLKIKSMRASIAYPQLYVGQKPCDSQLSIWIQYEDGSYFGADQYAKIISKNTKIAKIDENSCVVPVAPGKTTIEVTYKDKSQSIPITVNPAYKGNFTIQAPKNAKITASKFYYRAYSDPGAPYYFADLDRFKITKLKSGLKVTGINWKRTSHIRGVITTTGNRSYIVDLTSKNSGKTIVLKHKETTEVSVKLPFKNLTIDSVEFGTSAHKGGYFTNVKSLKFILPKGVYGATILAHDNKNYYRIVKNGAPFKGSKQTLIVNKEDLVLQNVKTENDMSLKGLVSYTGDRNGFGRYQKIVQKNATSASFYLNPDDYPSLTIESSIKDLWNYRFATPYRLEETNDTLTFSDDLKANVQFNEHSHLIAGRSIILETYEPTYDPIRQYDTGLLSITDKYGNRLVGVSSDDKKGNLQTILIFKNEENTFEIPVNPANPYFKLPSVPGTYDVTFKMTWKRK